MADAIFSFAVEQIAALLREQIQYHVKLVSGVEEEVESLSNELNTIRNVLNDAERQRFKNKSVNNWLTRLEHMAFEMEDVLDEWSYAILKLKLEHDEPNHHDDVAAHKQKKVWSFLPSCSCLPLKKAVVRHDIAIKLEEVKKQLDKLFKEKDRYNLVMSPPSDSSHEYRRVQSSDWIDLDKVHGRNAECDSLVSKLIMSYNNGGQLGESDSLHILSIVGVGGLGKTTLAQLVYNNDRVKGCFDLRIWICVSDLFDEAGVAKGIVDSIEKRSSPNIDQLSILCKKVRESVSGKRFLLVLDDVWTEDDSKWEPLKDSLKCGGEGSVILVTTRNERVAKMMGTKQNDIHQLGVLSREDCWLLLRRIAFSGRNYEQHKNLEKIGRNIAEKCKGLPLAAKTLGSLLRSKNTLEEWENIWKSEIWELGEVREFKSELFSHLLLSYNELSPALKRCFSFCAVFPKEYVIKVNDVIGMWIAQGYLGLNIGNSGDMEVKGREYFNTLAVRSLFQNFEKAVSDDELIGSFKMHDIVHDFAEFLRMNNREEVQAGMQKTPCQVCIPSLVSCVKEYQSLFLSYGECPPTICDCLKSLRALSVKGERHYLEHTSVCLQRIPQGMESLIHLRWLDLRHTKLSREDMQIIYKFYHLETLRLALCDIEEISSEIGNLIHLRHLDVSGNDLGKISEEIWNLIHLTHLDVSRNGLREVSAKIGNLIHLRHLDVGYNKLKQIPGEIEKLIQLRHLDLRENDLGEISWEIGNHIHLRYLDVSRNKSLPWLPDSICRLHELQTFKLTDCVRLSEIPKEIHGLINLKHLHNEGTDGHEYDQGGLAQLIGLRKLDRLSGGNDGGKLRWLKNLNHLTGSLGLKITLRGDYLDDAVEDAREAELRNKIHIRSLQIEFEGEEEDENECPSLSRVRMDVIDALEPHPNLQSLRIDSYQGSKLPDWIASLNHLTSINLTSFKRLASLPLLAKLPSLEELYLCYMDGVQFLGREFLGMATMTTTRAEKQIESSSSSSMPVAVAAAADATNFAIIAFPKLMTLRFSKCPNWKEWEDITAEEEEDSATTTWSSLIMPCLERLIISECPGLTALPHRLLRKLSTLCIDGSTQLIQRYGNKNGSAWKSISRNNPHLQLETSFGSDFEDNPSACFIM